MQHAPSHTMRRTSRPDNEHVARGESTIHLATAPARPPGSRMDRDRLAVLALITAVLVVVWIVAILSTHYVRFVVFTPRAKTGFDVTLSLLSLFVALVLALFPNEENRDRLRWVSLGFATLGIGGLVFGYLAPLLQSSDNLERSMYCSLAVRTAALMAIAIGMVPAAPPVLTRRNILLMSMVILVLPLVAVSMADQLPRLAHVEDLEAVAAESDATLEGLTGWHWLLSSAPLLLAVAGAVGTVRHARGITGGAWLTVAMVLMAGSQLHTMFWPSAYSPVLTTASILRLAFTLVVALGAVFALRQVAVERAAVLAAEQELASRLAEIARLRTDFTAMVAHELASPVAALQGYTRMLQTGSLGKAEQQETAAAIRTETELIRTLIDDVRMAARAERDDFRLQLQDLPLRPLLENTAAYGRTLPGGHPVRLLESDQAVVRADPDRIGQVLRNLVGNACKHTPPGTPVTLRATRTGDRVRIEVLDAGPGIHPDDIERIFEKFGRGRDALGKRVPGVGLGLYLSRRIIQAHGGQLGLEQTASGATFWIELDLAERP